MSSELIYEAIKAAPLDQPLPDATARRVAYEVAEAIGSSASTMEQLRRDLASAEESLRWRELVLSSILGDTSGIVTTDAGWWHLGSKSFGVTADATHGTLLAAHPEEFRFVAGPDQERLDLDPDQHTDSPWHRIDDEDGTVWEQVLCYWPDWTPRTDLPKWLQPVTHPALLDSQDRQPDPEVR